VVDEAGAQGESALDRGVREVDAAAAVDRAEQLEVAPIDVAVEPAPEAHRAELDEVVRGALRDPAGEVEELGGGEIERHLLIVAGLMSGPPARTVARHR